jgi:sec-independent protein translocase protein TatA
MHAALAALPVNPLAFLDGIGGMEMLLVFVIGLLLFGGKGMPDMARTLGKAIREFKRATSGVEDQLKRALDEPPPAPRRPHPASQPRPVELPPSTSLTPPTPPAPTPPGATPSEDTSSGPPPASAP